MFPMSRIFFGGMLACSAVVNAHETSVSVEHVWIHGPGGNLNSIFDRRVAGIERGRSIRLAIDHELVEGWRLAGVFEDGDLAYESPLDAGCPLGASTLVGAPLFFCQQQLREREGRIEDRLTAFRLGIEREIGRDTWRGAMGLGLAYASWSSDDDVEGRRLSNCESFGPGLVAPIRSPNCTGVRHRSTDSGPYVDVEVGYVGWAPFTGSIGFHAQRASHQIHQYDVLERFIGANCVGTQHCETVRLSRIAQPDASTWTWFEARASYRMTEATELFVRTEFAGTRDWTTLSAGVSYTF